MKTKLVLLFMVTFACISLSNAQETNVRLLNQRILSENGLLKVPASQNLPQLRAPGDWWEPNTVTRYTMKDFRYEERTERSVFTYDATGSIYSEVIQRLEDNVWKNEGKYIHLYNDKNNLLSRTFYVWVGSDWEYECVSDSYSYVYDNRGNILSYTYESSKDEKAPTGNYTYTYDQNNNKLTEIFRYNKAGGYDDYKKSWTYDQNNNILSETEQNWENDKWVDGDINTYTYDNQNTMLSVHSIWGSSMDKIEELATFTYDKEGKLATILIQRKNNNNNTWNDLYKMTYTYEGMTYTSCFQGWQYNGEKEWGNDTKQKWTQDEYGNCILGELWTWNANGWENLNSTIQLGYNLRNGNYPSYEKMITNNKVYKMAAAYTKLKSANSIQSLSANFHISIFPNPATDKITVFGSDLTIEKLSLFNQQGQLFKQVNQTSEMNVSDVGAGIYFLQIQTNEGVITEKVIKK